MVCDKSCSDGGLYVERVGIVDVVMDGESILVLCVRGKRVESI